MTKLTVITHVYNSQAGIDEQVARWKSYSAHVLQQVEFIVIDDCSSPPLTIDKELLNLRLFRVLDDIDWNMPGCRNLAAIQSQSDWLLYFDVDNIITAEQMEMIVLALGGLDKKTLYCFKRIYNEVEVEPHINTYLISRSGFFAVGGYDEDFSGHYGFEDVIFRNMWRKYVGGDVLFTNIAFNQLNHRTNDLNRDTTRNHELAQKKLIDGLLKVKNILRFHYCEIE